jgi:hypothetical protein
MANPTAFERTITSGWCVRLSRGISTMPIVAESSLTYARGRTLKRVMQPFEMNTAIRLITVFPTKNVREINMRKFVLPIIAVLAAFLAITLNVTPASAQATRTWVSGTGDDANPCSRTAPCKTFAGAISKTAAAGEINVIDPGGFGAVTITKAITIRSDHVEAGVLVSGTNGIVVAAGAADHVVLYGLDIEGVNLGLNGVQITSGGTIQIINCTIHQFTGSGVNVVSSTAGTRVTIKDTIITKNMVGVNVQGNGVANSANIMDTLIDGNASFGVQANGTGNAISLFRDTIIGSPVGVNAPNGGVVASRGPSNVITGTGAPATAIPFN